MPAIKQTELEKLSFEDLENTAALITTVIEARRRAAVESMKADLAAKCEALGVDLADVLRKPRKVVAAKYRNTDGTTWTGQGRRPLWMPEDKKNWGKFAVK